MRLSVSKTLFRPFCNLYGLASNALQDNGFCEKVYLKCVIVYIGTYFKAEFE